MSPVDEAADEEWADQPRPVLARAGSRRFTPARVLRLFRSEVALMFRRRRNLVLLAVLALVPVAISAAVKAGRDDGPGVFGGITDNGLFASFAALLVAGPVFLPLIVSVVAGDAVAGEASSGTLRYLLAAPVGRTRLLGVKAGALTVWCVACAAVVVALGLVVGVVLFPTGRFTLLSGTQIGFGDALGRLVVAGAYVAMTLLTVAAIGLFASTMTEVPVAAMAATVTLTIVSEVADAVPQLSGIHAWLPTHYWQRWVDLLREPVQTDGMTTGVWVSVGYIAFFLSAAWARFGGKDVTA